MNEWRDDRERQIAIQFGRCICGALGWKKPYFIPTDKAVVVAYGPKLRVLEEFLWDEATREFEKRVGRRLRRRFWQSVIDWQDKNVTLGELVAKLVQELDSAPELDATVQPTPLSRLG